MTREPFDLETALRVTLKEIQNCYANAVLNPEISVCVPMSFPGKYLDGLTEILFIFLQNAIKHSGFTKPQIKIQATCRDEWIEIKISNSIAPSVLTGQIAATAKKAIEQYKKDSALSLARSEGGSGWSKIWRIAEYDLKFLHALSFDFIEERFFTVVFSFCRRGG